MDIPIRAIPLFVYGTLQSSQKNNVLIDKPLKVYPAKVITPCRLWQNGYFPALEVYGSSGFYKATVDFIKDNRVIKFLRNFPKYMYSPKLPEPLEGPEEGTSLPWQPFVRGELVFLPYNSLYLDFLDRHEGFRPGEDRPLSYVRYLLPVQYKEHKPLTVAWVYVQEAPYKRGMFFCPGNKWPPCKEDSLQS
jgi:hypothetical protein